MRRLIREPLLHFFVLGALLFVLYASVNRDALRSPDEIVVDQARVDGLALQFERVWRRKVTREELEGLVDTWVREEIIYREGRAAGLDRDDDVVRRRVVQKMTFIAEGMATEVPSDAELDAWLRTHPELYRVPPAYTLRHVYFDPERHGPSLEADIAAAASALRLDPDAAVGDATLLPRTLSDASAEDIARTFGEDFADALHQAPADRWSEPIRSAYGVHLVRISARRPSRDPVLSEVRAAVERDLLSDRSRKATEDFYRVIRERYTVRF
jgi:hypothetical protein